MGLWLSHGVSQFLDEFWVSRHPTSPNPGGPIPAVSKSQKGSEEGILAPCTERDGERAEVRRQERAFFHLPSPLLSKQNRLRWSLDGLPPSVGSRFYVCKSHSCSTPALPITVGHCVFFAVSVVCNTWWLPSHMPWRLSSSNDLKALRKSSQGCHPPAPEPDVPVL